MRPGKKSSRGESVARNDRNSFSKKLGQKTELPPPEQVPCLSRPPERRLPPLLDSKILRHPPFSGEFLAARSSGTSSLICGLGSHALGIPTRLPSQPPRP